MHGIPASFDPNSLAGEELIQVCVGYHDLILRFHPSASILITSSVRFARNTGETITFNNLREAGCQLLNLIRASVVSASAPGGRLLRLEFGDLGALEIFDDSDQFESLVVRVGEKEFVA